MAPGMEQNALRAVMTLVIAGVMLAVTALAGRAEMRASTGVLAAATGPVEVRSMHDASAPRRLAVGARVAAGDEVVTGPNVRAQIMLRDGTTFAIGERAQLAIDEFTYDPVTGTGALGAVIRRGSFRFVSGRIAKTTPGNVRLVAGSTAIDINGTEVLGTINGVSDEVILMSGEVALTSIGGDCGGGTPQGDIFSIDDGGVLQSNVGNAGSSSASCSRALVRAGFGVQVASSGQMTSPGRATAQDVDTVIDAVTVKAGATPGNVPVASTASNQPAGQSVGQPAVQLALADARPATVAEGQQADNKDGMSAFDRIVMQTFGMTYGTAADAAKIDDKGDAGTQLQLATLQGSSVEDGPKEEEKTESGTSSGSGTADDKTIAAEEARYDAKIDEATRRTDGSSDTDTGTGTETSSETDSDSSDEGASPTPNTSPQLASISGFAFSDTSGDDSFSASTATASGSDRDSGDTLTYAISGQSADSSQSGYTHAASGSYGTLYINSGTGAYTYIPNDSAVEGASSTQSDSFTLSASDGTASATQGLTVTINGVDDVPTLASLGGISFTDTASDDSFTVASAAMSATERDTGDTITHAISGQLADTSRSGFTHARAGSYGTLYINSGTGAYEYVPNDSAIEG